MTVFYFQQLVTYSLEIMFSGPKRTGIECYNIINLHLDEIFKFFKNVSKKIGLLM